MFYAKSKSRHSNQPIPISSNKDIHIHGEHEFVLVPNGKLTKFSLMKNGQEVFTFNNIENPKSKYLPRVTTINVNTEELDFPIQHLKTKSPKMNKNGYWFLDFHNRMAIHSNKNAIFVNEENMEEILMCRKIADDKIEIDTIIETDPIIPFVIGISMFSKKNC